MVKAAHDDPTHWLPAILGGDDEAVAAWYRIEWPVVHRLAFGFLADSAEAQDLAQDAMMHLLDHLEGRDTDRSYRSWRNAVVANLCRDRLRRMSARRRAESVQVVVEPRPLPSPEDEAAGAEVREVLVAALSVLTPREREVFVLRDLEGAGFAEIAEALAIRQSTARSLLTLARRRLRRTLGARLAKGREDSDG